ncbi:MAG: dihydrofolate reductase family protein [Bacteroidetes bacterium]|nr:dihydrofolate reductase family protein [Bacteroidota bacterium]
MKKLISFMHISLDGFVAGPNGEMDWITLNNEIFDHVGRRIQRENTAMYGRVTYELMESYWPTAADKPNPTKHEKEHSAWYKTARKVVISRSLQNADLPDTTILSNHLPESIHALKQEPGNEMLLFGSPSATHALLDLNLIDGFWLFLNPILLGEGIPLFAGVKDKTKLQLQNSRTFDCGVIELNYTVAGK